MLLVGRELVCYESNPRMAATSKVWTSSLQMWNSEAKRRLCDTGITVTRGSGTKMPYEENSFDCVIRVEGEPHMNRREDFF